MSNRLEFDCPHCLKPNHGALDEPCAQCQDWMKQGIILMSVCTPRTREDLDRPYHTGSICLVSEDFIRRVIKSKASADAIIKRRYSYVPDAVWDAHGLPRDGVMTEPKIPARRERKAQ